VKILILSSAFSGLTQRTERELVLLGHSVEKNCEPNEASLLRQLGEFLPDLIICPFLTWRIPEQVWREYLCLIVHPGIEGDRGPSSLDWAISEEASEWGVTLLQAAVEMDAGDIWGTRVFPMRPGSKLSIYKREVSTAAIALIKQALHNAKDGDFKPRWLDYRNPAVQGRLRPTLRQDSRRINWQLDSTQQVVAKINAADTSPGAADSIHATKLAFAGQTFFKQTFPVRLYGAVAEPNLRGEAGELLGLHGDAACYATTDGAVWVRQLKCPDHPELPPIKLPAATVLQKISDPEMLRNLPAVRDTRAIDDIVVERKGDTAYLYFNFYNGAASTRQCLALKNRLAALKASDVKIIVLMGGEDFWSNGIHLNCIEAADDPALESWQNINAMNDLIREIIDTPRQITVAALRNNAGAGGAIMALACDKVIVREGVVLNPHYKSMGLYGSEYWTYLLPRRIGQQAAEHVTEACEPMLAAEALALGLADVQLVEDWDAYQLALHNYLEGFSQHTSIDHFLQRKVRQRADDESVCPLQEYRSNELAEMRKSFYDLDSEYHHARRAFVYKQKRNKQQPLLARVEEPAPAFLYNAAS
jgi:putative two-component system protein, hydrogenase maturation factor HypX/HoxX